MLFNIVLLMALKLVSGLFENCDEVRTIRANEAIYINSQNYPVSTYNPGGSCRYTLKTVNGYNIQIFCQINLNNCNNDKFFVSADGDQSLITSPSYCGFSNVTGTSLFNEISFGHVSQFQISAGYYSCYLVSRVQLQCECGWSVNRKIINGKEAGINEFISMVGIKRVGYPYNYVYAGGTLIHFRFVLTAAHVVADQDPNQLQIVVGEHNLNTENETPYTKIYDIERIIVNDYYSQTNYNYDIALLRTRENIQFNRAVGPACLPANLYQSGFDLRNKDVTIAGWGSTISFGGPAATTLQKVTMKVISKPACNYYGIRFNVTFGLNPFKFCTLSTEYGDTCQGDSGGGVYINARGRLYVVGIVSFGLPCGLYNAPSVNTRLVFQLLFWISSTINDPANICNPY